MEDRRVPIMIDGVVQGYVEIHPCGAMTEFYASCDMRPGVVRLSVYGDGREGYLGVLAPEGKQLILRKCFTRLQMKSFPQNPTEAGIAGRLSQRTEPPKREQISEVCDGLVWYSSPEGVLVSFDGEHSLVAFRPGCEPPTDAPGQRKEIDGQEYIVYITKNGRISQQ